MKLYVSAALVTTVLGFAISNLVFLTAEINEAMHRLTYQRLIPIRKSSKKWNAKTKTAYRQAARRTLFCRHRHGQSITQCTN